MRFSVLFASFFAGILALPVPQAGVSQDDGRDIEYEQSLIPKQTGLGDVLSGTAQGTGTLESGGVNNAVNSAGNSMADVSSSAGNLINRSPIAQVGVSAWQTANQKGVESLTPIDRPARATSSPEQHKASTHSSPAAPTMP